MQKLAWCGRCALDRRAVAAVCIIVAAIFFMQSVVENSELRVVSGVKRDSSSRGTPAPVAVVAPASGGQLPSKLYQPTSLFVHGIVGHNASLYTTFASEHGMMARAALSTPFAPEAAAAPLSLLFIVFGSRSEIMRYVAAHSVTWLTDVLAAGRLLLVTTLADGDDTHELAETAQALLLADASTALPLALHVCNMTGVPAALSSQQLRSRLLACVWPLLLLASQREAFQYMLHVDAAAYFDPHRVQDIVSHLRAEEVTYVGDPTCCHTGSEQERALAEGGGVSGSSCDDAVFILTAATVKAHPQATQCLMDAHAATGSATLGACLQISTHCSRVIDRAAWSAGAQAAAEGVPPSLAGPAASEGTHANDMCRIDTTPAAVSQEQARSCAVIHTAHRPAAFLEQMRYIRFLRVGHPELHVATVSAPIPPAVLQQPTCRLAIGVHSSPGRVLLRNAIRATWMRVAEALGRDIVQVRFLVQSQGTVLPHDRMAYDGERALGPDDLLELPSRAAECDDCSVKQGLAWMGWAFEHTHCDFIMTVRDDAYLNLPALLEHLSATHGATGTASQLVYFGNMVGAFSTPSQPTGSRIPVTSSRESVGIGGAVYVRNAPAGTTLPPYMQDVYGVSRGLAELLLRHSSGTALPYDRDDVAVGAVIEKLWLTPTMSNGGAPVSYDDTRALTCQQQVEAAAGADTAAAQAARMQWRFEADMAGRNIDCNARFKFNAEREQLEGPRFPVSTPDTATPSGEVQWLYAVTRTAVSTMLFGLPSGVKGGMRNAEAANKMLADWKYMLSLRFTACKSVFVHSFWATAQLEPQLAAVASCGNNLYSGFLPLSDVDSMLKRDISITARSVAAADYTIVVPVRCLPNSYDEVRKLLATAGSALGTAIIPGARRRRTLVLQPSNCADVLPTAGLEVSIVKLDVARFNARNMISHVIQHIVRDDELVIGMEAPMFTRARFFERAAVMAVAGDTIYAPHYFAMYGSANPDMSAVQWEEKTGFWVRHGVDADACGHPLVFAGFGTDLRTNRASMLAPADGDCVLAPDAGRDWNLASLSAHDDRSRRRARLLRMVDIDLVYAPRPPSSVALPSKRTCTKRFAPGVSEDVACRALFTGMAEPQVPLGRIALDAQRRMKAAHAELQQASKTNAFSDHVKAALNNAAIS